MLIDAFQHALAALKSQNVRSGPTRGRRQRCRFQNKLSNSLLVTSSQSRSRQSQLFASCTLVNASTDSATATALTYIQLRRQARVQQHSRLPDHNYRTGEQLWLAIKYPKRCRVFPKKLPFASIAEYSLTARHSRQPNRRVSSAATALSILRRGRLPEVVANYSKSCQ